MKVAYMIALGTLLCTTGWAKDTDITCKASGKSLSKNGEGLVPAEASLTFTLTTRRTKNTRIISDIEGYVKAANGPNEELTYQGTFDIDSLKERAEYKPNKYKGFSQFLNFDATDTKGSAEDGMWGQFILEKNTSKANFDAHYIFQAGDHMGGTLHLSCSKDK
jgi:hypothetical protein